MKGLFSRPKAPLAAPPPPGPVQPIPPDHPGLVAPAPAQRREGGALEFAPGYHGCAMYGPYVSVPAGLYRVSTETAAGEGGDSQLYWDIYANGRVYAGREFTNGSRVVVHLPDTNQLEFRFTTHGRAFVHRGVELQALLLDRTAASAGELHALIDQLRVEDTDPEALFRTFERLAAAGDVKGAEARRQAYVAGGGRIYARLRGVLLELHTPGLKTLTHVPEASREQIEKVVELWPLQRFNVHPQNLEPVLEADKVELLRRGYQPDFIHATRLHRSLMAPRRPWQVGPTPASSPEPAPRPPTFEALVNIDLSFQADLARGEGLVAYCPVSGRELRSNHGFCQHIFGLPQTIYRFEGAEVFYVCTGGASGSRMFMYMPRTGTLVLIEEPVIRWYPYEQIVREFLINLLVYARDVRDYLNAPAKPAAVLGLNNIGHFFWNDLTGMNWMVEQKLDRPLAQIVKVRSQFIDYEALFPELAKKPFADVPDPKDVFIHFVRNRLTPIRFSDYVISPAFFERVQRGAAARATPAGSPPLDAPRPLLWINLRAHNKVWVDQVEGYANILNQVFEDYGSASALLDGTKDCAPIAAEIRRRVRPEVQLYDGLNFSIYDTIHYASQCDAYLCVVGAGLTLLTHMNHLRGVTHAEHGHMEHLSWWGYIRPEMHPPLAPPQSAITEIGQGWWCDYKVDWRLLYDLLTTILDEGFSRTSPR